MSQITSRAQAKAAGLKTYFTGNPCPQGHIANRKTKSGTCVECCNQGTKQWHAKNADHNADYGKEYRKKRGDELLKAKRNYQREWIAQNKDEKRRRDAEYEKQKREEKNASFLASRAAITKRYESARHSAVPAWADHDLINDMYQLAQVFRSIGLDIHVDHIVPLQGKTVSGLHTHDNLQLMIRSANQAKGNRIWPDMP